MSSSDSFKSTMDAIGVTRLGNCDKVTLDKPKPTPDNRNSIAAKNEILEQSLSCNPEHSGHQIDSDEELQKPGLKSVDFKKLKQGKIHRQDSLSVRGFTVDKSSELIKEFLLDAVRSNYRCVKIIHGKGLNSPDGISRVKLNTQSLLAQNRFVLGYCKALPNDGGSGAKYVLLKRRR